MKEISDVIMLVEDRMNEILESGDLKYQVDNSGYPIDEHVDTVTKFRFLKKLSKDLTNFDIGRY